MSDTLWQLARQRAEATPGAPMLVDEDDRSLDFRGFAGTISSGVVRPGDEVVAVPSGMRSTVERIVTFDGDLEVAGPGQAVTLTLTDEIDISRGDLIVSADHLPARAHDIEASLVWMSDEAMEPGRQYLLQSVNGLSNASVRAAMRC